MSAIAAILNLDGQAVTLAELQRMGRALASLGGEGEHYWHAGNVGFCHGLMRFTPQDEFERQPLLHPPSGTVVVADARVDQREELASQLGLTSAELQGLPDSRLLADAWLRWGPGLVDRVLGSWVVVVWEPRQQRLFAACSVGEAPPLYFHHSPRHLLLATMPRGIFATGRLQRRLSGEWLADFLISYLRFSRQSPWQAMDTLFPGEFLEVAGGRLRIQRYWHPQGVEPQAVRSDAEVLAAFREHFDRAVQARLRRRGQAAVFLSGGLDSSLIAAAAATSLAGEQAPLLSFTQVPEAAFECNDSFREVADESPLVRLLAEAHPSLRPALVDAAGLTFLELGEQYFRHSESPFRNAGNLAWMMECGRLAALAGADMYLDGNAGNEIFSWGGEILLAWLLRQGRLREAWIQAGYPSPATPLVRLRRLAGAGLLPLLPEAVHRAWRRRRVPPDQGPPPVPITFSPIRRTFLESSGSLERAREVGHDFDFLPLLRRRWARGMTLVSGDRAWNAAQRSLWRIDRRVPARDRRLAEFCLALPVDQFARDGVTRRLARIAFPGRVPAAILNRRRRGVQGADFLQRLHRRRDRIRELLSDMRRSPWCTEALDLDRLEELARGFPEPGATFSPPLYLRWERCLAFGLCTGLFLLWVEKGAPVVDDEHRPA
ncbi:MAG: asparagine synthase-related protein [Acidobacteriota bacterium]